MSNTKTDLQKLQDSFSETREDHNEPLYNTQFELLSTDVELSDEDEGVVSLFEQHYYVFGVKVINYLTEDKDGNKRYFEVTKDPEELTRDERHRVLGYSLSTFDDDEIVNYYDLFLQGEFIKEVASLREIK